MKIWTSRVDSVGAETAKLASNLAGGRDTDDEEDDGSDNPDDEGTQSKKKKTQRSGATLAKDAAQLRSKKLDLEFSVDPLFKKTCADFDEGGAHGLLMNHLSLGVGKTSGLRVIFDASDSIYKEEEDDDEEPYEEVDLSHLRSELLSEPLRGVSYIFRHISSQPCCTGGQGHLPLSRGFFIRKKQRRRVRWKSVYG